MKTSKRIDALGRIVIPADIRIKLDIHPNDILDIDAVGNTITVNKHQEVLNVERFIRQFVITYYGSEYMDLLIPNQMIDEISSILKEYFTKVLK